MIHAIDGTIALQRPLRDLATVFDMTGIGCEVSNDALCSREDGLSIDATHASAGIAMTGHIDDAHFDPDQVLRRLSLAMEADGIRFTLRLLDADGVARVTYESDR